MGRWYWPFIVVTVSPLLTVPLTMMLFDHVQTTPECSFVWAERPLFKLDGVMITLPIKDWRCPGSRLAIAYLPGLVNLLPLLWLRGGGKVRLAALLAGTLGLLRFGLPMSRLLGADGPVSYWDGQPGYSGLVFWMITFLVFLGFWAVTLKDPGPRPPNLQSPRSLMSPRPRT